MRAATRIEMAAFALAAGALALLALVALLGSGCNPDPAPPDGDDDAGDDDASSDDDGADDDGADDDDAGDDDTIHEYSCTPVGAGHADGFFSLRGFDGQLYAGEFGYGQEGASMVWRYAPWELTSPGLLGVGESVCAMREFDGLLYANTENSGDISRTADGSSWERVHDGDGGTIGCGLEVFGGRLYAVQYDYATHTHGQVLRSADGSSWEVVWDSGGDDDYLREIASHDGVLYAFGVDEGADQPFQLTSSDGTSWSEAPTPSRFFRAHSWDGALWLGSTDSRGGGLPGVWRLDGDGLQMVHHADKHYVTELVDWDGALFAGTSDGFKDDVGTSSLLMSRDGEQWEVVCAFPEIAVWSIAVAGGALYVGTWQFMAGGQVHRVEITEVEVGDDDAGDDDSGGVDCALIEAANPAWEVCESGPDRCAGVFADGAGCQAFCAPAGLSCVARYGGEPGCVMEPGNPLDCFEDLGHQSDWCECG